MCAASRLYVRAYHQGCCSRDCSNSSKGPGSASKERSRVTCFQTSLLRDRGWARAQNLSHNSQECQDWVYISDPRMCHKYQSGQVRPRQGTEICNFGAPSALEALHWMFCFFSSIYVQFSKTSPTKSGESSKKSSGEDRVKSCHVCGCHGFFGPESEQIEWRRLFYRVTPKSSKNKKNILRIFPLVRDSLLKWQQTS